MEATIRPVQDADIEACGRIIFEAFDGIAAAHGHSSPFPTVEDGIQLARARIMRPSVYGVAEQDGQIVGSGFLSEGDPIRGVGPITVSPSIQQRGIGRQLMHAVMERARGAISMRLIQDAVNTASMALYASLGFDVKEPLVQMIGTPRGQSLDGAEVRPMVADDLDACVALGARVLGFERREDLQDALEAISPVVVVRSGRITAYVSAMPVTPQAHAVAATVEDLGALLIGAAGLSGAPLTFLLPTRQAESFRWCLRAGLRAVRPMTLMTMGAYQEPEGCYLPSSVY